MENFNYYYQYPHHQTPSSSSSPSRQNPHLPPKERRKATGGAAPKHGGGGGTKLSTDPQSVAARERRHRISDRFRILKGLVPGGSKMDTVSMLEEAISYVKFLKAQIWLHEAAAMLHGHEDFSPLPHASNPNAVASLRLPLHDPIMESAMPSATNLVNGAFHGGHEIGRNYGF